MRELCARTSCERVEPACIATASPLFKGPRGPCALLDGEGRTLQQKAAVWQGVHRWNMSNMREAWVSATVNYVDVLNLRLELLQYFQCYIETNQTNHHQTLRHQILKSEPECRSRTFGPWRVRKVDVFSINPGLSFHITQSTLRSLKYYWIILAAKTNWSSSLGCEKLKKVQLQCVEHSHQRHSSSWTRSCGYFAWTWQSRVLLVWRCGCGQTFFWLSATIPSWSTNGEFAIVPPWHQGQGLLCNQARLFLAVWEAEKQRVCLRVDTTLRIILERRVGVNGSRVQQKQGVQNTTNSHVQLQHRLTLWSLFVRVPRSNPSGAPGFVQRIHLQAIPCWLPSAPMYLQEDSWIRPCQGHTSQKCKTSSSNMFFVADNNIGVWGARHM